MFLQFWLALAPFAIRWLDENNFAPLPAAAYGFILDMAAIRYLMLERTLIACNGLDSALARAVRRQRKGKISIAINTAGIGLAFVEPWIAIALYTAVAVMWFVPDRRIEAAAR